MRREPSMRACCCMELEVAALVLELVEQAQAVPAPMVMPATPERPRNRRATVIEWLRAGWE